MSLLSVVGVENGSLSMADSKQIQQIVERVVAQVFDRQLPKLQSELVEKVLAELPADGAASAKPRIRSITRVSGRGCFQHSRRHDAERDPQGVA